MKRRPFLMLKVVSVAADEVPARFFLVFVCQGFFGFFSFFKALNAGVEGRLVPHI